MTLYLYNLLDNRNNRYLEDVVNNDMTIFSRSFGILNNMLEKLSDIEPIYIYEFPQYNENDRMCNIQFFRNACTLRKRIIVNNLT